jgi:hypothetical protein
MITNKKLKPEVLAFFDQLALAGFQAEPIFPEASDDYVVDIHRGYATTGRCSQHADGDGVGFVERQIAKAGQLCRRRTGEVDEEHQRRLCVV